MLWETARERFPNQWLRVIPFDPYEKRGKVYIDEVAIVDAAPDAGPEEEGVSYSHGYGTIVCHTTARYIELELDVLPRDTVRKFGLIDTIYEEGHAIGMLKARCSIEHVSDRLHMSIADVKNLMATRVKDEPWIVQTMRDAGMSADEIMRYTGLTWEEIEGGDGDCVQTDKS